jgi:N-acetylglucosaminyldiphosphoundecaprenol N-acetyl-beta-D-mannosaminyltransferase
MEYMHENILGIGFTIDKKDDILEEIEKYLKKDQRSEIRDQKKRIKSLVIFTPNPEIVIFAQKNSDFRRIVNSAQIKIPDGFGISWALKKLHNLAVDRLSGTDLMLDLVGLCGKKGFTIGLIGGRGEVAVRASKCLRVKNPSVKIIVFPAPEIEMRQQGKTKLIIRDSSGRIIDDQKYFRDLLEEISRKRIDILFVALGFPKQEYFIEEIRNQKSRLHLPPARADGGQAKIKEKRPLVLMSVGGAFDYISGEVQRAPIWMRKRGLEWLYRLWEEPWRLGRQLKGAEFFLRVLLQR